MAVKVWHLVFRLYRRMRRIVVHFSILLLVFGAAAYKAEHTPLLACSLLSELSTLLHLLGKIQVRAPSHPRPTSRVESLNINLNNKP